jgi:transposase
MTSVGIDIAKDIHWASAIDAAGNVLLDRKVANTPQDLMRLADELPARVKVGIDVLGGIASPAQAVLLEAGFELVHVSGLAVNRARQGTVGGESKSDPRDARIIADQVRTRRDLRAVVASSELDVELRLLVSRRRDLTEEQTRRLSRMHDLLATSSPSSSARSISPPRRRSSCSASSLPRKSCARPATRHSRPSWVLRVAPTPPNCSPPLAAAPSANP